MASEGSIIQLPSDLLIGAGSGAYQVEGGWNADGKSKSIWDVYFHTKQIKVVNPYAVEDTIRRSYTHFHRGTDIFQQLQDQCMSIVSGDVACDSYNKIDEDVQNLVQLGVNIYRFSISWSRVLPKADDRFPNEAGINYYKTLIGKLLENNIQPVVTMYHWDLPAVLQNLGGWANPYVVGYFNNYAKFLFKTFGEQVKLWSTINEPRFVAVAYGTDEGVAPAAGDIFNGIGEYMVIRNVLLAHASVYKMYKNEFKEQQQGEISLCLDTSAYFPENPDDETHQEAVSKTFDFTMGVFTEPLVSGEFPKSVIDAIQEVSDRENINMDRILKFTEEEKKDIIGSYDFIAFNYYNSYKVRPMVEGEYIAANSLLTKDLGIVSSANDENLNDTFRGFTQVVDWLVEHCNNPKLFITENGICEKPNEDQSELKINYHRGILTELDKALKKGVKIIGYSVWSFMDSLEWTSGYFSKLYGIYSVDFNHPDRPRSKKPSFEFFENLFKTKTLEALDYEQ